MSTLFEKFVKKIQPLIFAARYPGLSVRIEPKTKALFDEICGVSAIICPNHSHHEDGELLFLISILVGQQFKFLAAREMFDSYFGLGGVVLRQLGCFEVDRGGGDNGDVVHATVKQLSAFGAKVVIFPEGEIGYDNDRLGALEPGAAAIGLDTFIHFQHQGQDRDVLIVPLAVKYQFDNVEKVCNELLSRLESELKLNAAPDSVSVHDRARTITEAFLESKEKQLGLASCEKSGGEKADGISVSNSCSSIDERVLRVFSASLQKMAETIGCKVPNGTEKHRLHHLQSRIFVKRSKASLFQKARYDRMDKQTILLNRLLSIKSDEFDQATSIHSLVDMLCNLDVLITGRFTPDAHRTVVASATDPLEMSSYAADWRHDREAAIHTVTEKIRAQLQQKLLQVEDSQSFSDFGGNNLTLRKSI